MLKLIDIDAEEYYKHVYLHRLIMGAKEDEIVDHLNHIPEDNRRKNLRIVSKAANNVNADLRKNNTSGCTGVYLIGSKWTAKVYENRTEINLGYFDRYEEAVAARKSAEEKYYGDYSYDNSMALAEQNGYVDLMKPA